MKQTSNAGRREDFGSSDASSTFTSYSHTQTGQGQADWRQAVKMLCEVTGGRMVTLKEDADKSLRQRGTE